MWFHFWATSDSLCIVVSSWHFSNKGVQKHSKNVFNRSPFSWMNLFHSRVNKNVYYTWEYSFFYKDNKNMTEVHWNEGWIHDWKTSFQDSTSTTRSSTHSQKHKKNSETNFQRNKKRRGSGKGKSHVRQNTEEKVRGKEVKSVWDDVNGWNETEVWMTSRKGPGGLKSGYPTISTFKFEKHVDLRKRNWSDSSGN